MLFLACQVGVGLVCVTATNIAVTTRACLGIPIVLITAARINKNIGCQDRSTNHESQKDNQKDKELPFWGEKHQGVVASRACRWCTTDSERHDGFTGMLTLWVQQQRYCGIIVPYHCWRWYVWWWVVVVLCGRSAAFLLMLPVCQTVNLPYPPSGGTIRVCRNLSLNMGTKHSYGC